MKFQENERQKVIVWRILQLLLPKLCHCCSSKIVRFQNGSNKVAIELRVVQFGSEIILVISNHAYDFSPNCTVLSSIAIFNTYFLIYHMSCVCSREFASSGWLNLENNFPVINSLQTQSKKKPYKNNLLTSNFRDLVPRVSHLTLLYCPCDRLSVGLRFYRKDLTFGL